jgi:alcohol/geraniol dehydrogenase (NADP+)
MNKLTIHAFAAHQIGGSLDPFEFELGPLKPDEVEIEVNYCGICFSDIHMLRNDWGVSRYPLVPGHEVIGIVVEKGIIVEHLKVGQQVGLGWRARSCLACDQCLAGYHNRCPKGEDVIVGRHGGYAARVRCQGIWAFPLPEGINPKTAGPLFCGGITVFNPLIQNNTRPTDHVAVVGIGGLGHIAIKILNAWGCDVTGISSNADKEKDAREFGASHFLHSREPDSLMTHQNNFDLILVTANVELEWDTYVGTLRLSINVSPLNAGEKSIGASPIGGPAEILMMLDFCSRHKIEPMIEEYPLSRVNEALKHLESGKARYRIVLQNDLE